MIIIIIITKITFNPIPSPLTIFLSVHKYAFKHPNIKPSVNINTIAMKNVVSDEVLI